MTTDITETTLPSQNTILSSPTSNFFLEYKTGIVLYTLSFAIQKLRINTLNYISVLYFRMNEDCIIVE